MSSQFTFRWNSERAIDRALLTALAPFRTHARSRRLRELAMLGLLAERAGLRVDGDRLAGALPDASQRFPSPVPPAPTELSVPTTGVLALDEEALQAGNDLLASLGIG